MSETVVVFGVEVNIDKAKPHLDEMKRLITEQRKAVRDESNTSSKSYELKKNQLAKTEASYKAVSGAVKEQERESKRLDKQNQLIKKSFGNVTQQLTAMRQRMVDMRLAGEGGTQEFKNLQKEAGNLQDAIDKTSQEVKFFADDMNKVQGMSEIVTGLAATWRTAAGAMTMLGIKTENWERTMQRLMAAQQVAQGLQQISNMLRKESAAMMLINIGITKAKTAKTIIAAKAQALFNAVMAANPIGLVVAAIAALIAGIILAIKYWDQITAAVKRNADMLLILLGPLGVALLIYRRFFRESKNVAEATEQVAEKVETTAERVTRLKNEIEKLGKAYSDKQAIMQHELELLKAQGEGIDTIRRKERQLITEELEYHKMRLKLKEQQIGATYEEAMAMLQRNESMARAMGWTEEKIKQHFEEIEAISQLQKQLEIFDTRERTRRQDRAKAERDERQKRLDAELKASLELAVMRAEAGDQQMQARVKQAQELFALETRGMDKTSVHYQLAWAKLSEEINKIRLEYEMDVQAEIEEATENHLQRLLELRKANTQDIKEQYEIEKELLALQREEEMEKYAENEEMLIELEQYYDNLREELNAEYQERLLQQNLDRINSQFEAEMQAIKASQRVTQSAMGAITAIYEDGSERQKDAMKSVSLVMAGLKLSETIISTARAIMAALETQNYAGALYAGIQGALASIKIIGEQRKIQQMYSGGIAGYTGRGGKYEPAGEPELIQKHKGEVVWSQEDVRQSGGWRAVDNMRPTKGYADGGVVGFGETGAIAQEGEARMLNAIREIRPVVTVEDINAKSYEERQRVEVTKI